MESNPTVVFPEPMKVVIEEREIPIPGPQEILIKTKCTLISQGTELTRLRGKFSGNSAWSNLGKFPLTPGYSNVGEVIDAGKEVNKKLIGKKVVTYSPHSAFVLSSPERLKIIDKDVPDEEVAFFALAGTCMNGVRRGKITLGESVAIYGLGILGQLTTRFCWLAGARLIFGIEIARLRLERLPERPGVIGINPKKEDLKLRVKEETDGRMVDVVFEVTGNPDLIPEEFSILKRQGRFVVLSSPWGPTPLFDFRDLCNRPSFTIIGAHVSSHPEYSTPYNQWTRQRHFELFLNFLYNGELDISNLITHKIHYSKAPEIYRMLLEDGSKAMGVILEWT